MNPHETSPEQQQVIDQVLSEEASYFYRTRGRKPTTGTLGTKQARAFYPNDPATTDLQIAGIRFRHDPGIEDGIKLDGEEPWSPTLHQPPKPRLFVWPNFSPDYSTGLAFAVATTEEQARQAIEQRLGFTPTEWGSVEIHDTTEPVAYARTGGG